MKKTLIALVLLLLLVATPALAAGKMTVTQENFYAVDSYSIYGYVFARVENTGDKQVEFSAGLLEVFDEDADTLTSTDYLHAYPKYLQPGEYGYVYAYDKIDDASSVTEVDDYMLTVTGKGNSEDSVYRFPCTPSYVKDVAFSKYSVYNCMVVEFTNDTDEVAYGIEGVLTLLDEEENILFMDTFSLYDSYGLNPGASMTIRLKVSSSFEEAFVKNNLTPDHVDAIVYVEK